MNNLLWPLMAVALMFPLIGRADDSSVLLKGKDVTEAELIDALTPKKPMRTRSFGRDSAVAAKSAAASLLITFTTNSAELSDEGKQILDTVGRALTSNSLKEFRFDIEGHADPRGSDEYNLRLSRARAEAARQYLVSHYHISEERLKAIGKGRRELLNTVNPIAPENRRVTFKTVVQ